jgi:hypothetical protein
MKLRIRGNSVRVRLTRSEVRQLDTGAIVEQVTQIAPGVELRSAVEPAVNVSVPGVTLSGTSLVVHVPQTVVNQWAQTDEVTISAKQDVVPGTSLQILIEKDFECVHSRNDENADAFPNPREQHDHRSMACTSGSIELAGERFARLCD